MNPEDIKIDQIPFGEYCYEILDVDLKGSVPRIKTRNCPFWSKNITKPEQENGYCSYLDQGDWEGFGLLWDQVKECSINLSEDI